ncbi:MAG TPA: hypothetical protein PKY87_18995, partial [Terricaulis sp.]|nr:hypothetical protein [Terricaulis sp.]
AVLVEQEVIERPAPAAALAQPGTALPGGWPGGALRAAARRRFRPLTLYLGLDAKTFTAPNQDADVVSLVESAGSCYVPVVKEW